MEYKTLKNVSDKNITDYPISEAEFNSQGEMIIDNEGKYKTTGQTLKWTIKSGEVIKFPEYVANILLQTYGVEELESGRCLLKEVETIGEKEEKPIVVEGVRKDYTCRKCGKSFVSAKGLALHLAARHEEELK